MEFLILTSSHYRLSCEGFNSKFVQAQNAAPRMFALPRNGQTDNIQNKIILGFSKWIKGGMFLKKPSVELRRWGVFIYKLDNLGI